MTKYQYRYQSYEQHNSSFRLYFMVCRYLYLVSQYLTAHQISLVVAGFVPTLDSVSYLPI